jgi:uncharacterized membrane protein YuzA (DUF378 family)
MKSLTILASVGAINWLLVAFNWNLVEALLGFSSVLVTIVYIVIGISGVLLLIKVCKCKGGDCSKKCDTCSVKEAAPALDYSQNESQDQSVDSEDRNAE